MFTRKPLSVAVNRTLSGVAIAATAASIPALVQAQEKLEEVVVTGSRIPEANAITSSPVSTISAQDLQIHGITRVEDLLNKAPQVFASNTSNDSNGATGTATVDLRGLGPARTLALINGHRIGLGDPYELAPDINQIPGAMVDRVEVLTGGASATYGSDAIAGVVNFIMKRDFEGVQVDYQYSAYQHDNNNKKVQAAIDASGFQEPDSSVWDGDTHDISVIMGVNSPDGKGNITGYIGYRDIGSVLQGNRDYSACALGGAVTTYCGGSATKPEGFFSPFDGTGKYFTVSGNNMIPWDGTYYNYAPLNYWQRPDKRYTAGLFGHYDIDEHFKPYVEFQFMDDRSLAQIAPSGAFFVTSTLNCSNPFLSAQEFGAIGCTAPTDVVPLYIGRRNVEGGPRFDDLGHTSYRLLFGMNGDINQDWKYDGFANFSRTIYNETYNNDLSTTRIIRALNVVPGPGGVPTCQSVIDGSDPTCVPWNIFQTGGVTQAAVDYLKLPLFSKARLNEDQMVGYVEGDLTSMGIVSPWASTGVDIVLGGEYRDQRMDFEPDLGYQSGDAAGQGATTPPVHGDVEVTEFFMEGKIPVVEDRPFMKSVSLDVGYRYSDYSTSVSTNTWKGNGEWTPVTGFKIRGGYSRAVREANINELFQPQRTGLFLGTDPCATATPTATAAQCANSGVTAAQYGSVPKSPAQQYYSLSGGNPNLNPEKADTYTVGAVFQPDQVPGLLFSIDYWDVSVEDAITAIDPQFILDTCVATGDPSLCAQIHRGPAGDLWLGTGGHNITSTNINIGFFETAGIDFQGSYSMDVMNNYGTLIFNFNGTLLEKWDQQNIPGAAVDDCKGKWGGACGTYSQLFPNWKHVFTATWNTPWNMTFAATWRYIDGMKSADPANNPYNLPSVNYVDLAAIYTPTFINFGETKFLVGVNNVADEDPPVNGFLATAAFSNGNSIAGVYDNLGRYFFFGVTQKF